MGRLIDVDKLKEDIGVAGLLIAYRDRDEIKRIKDIINRQPTAYDVDEVVEQLKETSYTSYGDFESVDTEVVNQQEAIEIVKGGGQG